MATGGSSHSSCEHLSADGRCSPDGRKNKRKAEIYRDPGNPDIAFSNQSWTVMMLGDSNSGKTGLCMTFCYGQNSRPLWPTNGVNQHFHNMEPRGRELRDLKNVTLRMIDMGGHMQNPSPAFNHHMREADGFMLCFSIMQPSTLVNLKSGHYQRLIQSAKSGQHCPTGRWPMVVCATKKDREGRIDEYWMEETEIPGVQKQLGLPVFMTSDKGVGIREAFFTLATMIHRMKNKPDTSCEIL